jgi:GNAT superfamily N-acetyltransferase
MEPRSALDSEIDALAHLWHSGWQDTHAAILPAELAKHRTLESFRDRLQANILNVRVAGSSGQPLGFCMIKTDELYQLYVAPAARGSGIAAVLLNDGEEWLRSHGVQTAWLACAIGNERAARFYEKNGWSRVGNMLNQVETTDGDFPLEVWRYEKDLVLASHRPAVGVAHVVLKTDRMEETARFMRMLGMRAIFDGPQVSVYEMRGGTHLILLRQEAVTAGDATFDLMVDDIDAAHARFTSMGLAPSPIEGRPTIDHKTFKVREPAGHVLTVFSSHASGKPV